MNVEIWRQNIIILFGNNEAALLFHFWEYINRNQTFILDSHRPFIYSVAEDTVAQMKTTYKVLSVHMTSTAAQDRLNKISA